MFINEIEVVSAVLEGTTDPVVNGPIYTSGEYIAGPPPVATFILQLSDGIEILQLSDGIGIEELN